MVSKCQRSIRRIGLFSEGKENYESDIEDKMDLDQADNDKNPF